MSSGIKSTDMPDFLAEIRKNINELQRSVNTLNAVASDLMSNASKAKGKWSYNSQTATGNASYFDSTENNEYTLSITEDAAINIGELSGAAPTTITFTLENIGFTKAQFEAAYPAVADTYKGMSVTLTNASAKSADFALTTIAVNDSTPNIVFTFTASGAPEFVANDDITITCTGLDYIIPKTRTA